MIGSGLAGLCFQDEEHVDSSPVSLGRPEGEGGAGSFTTGGIAMGDTHHLSAPVSCHCQAEHRGDRTPHSAAWALTPRPPPLEYLHCPSPCQSAALRRTAQHSCRHAAGRKGTSRSAFLWPLPMSAAERGASRATLSPRDVGLPWLPAAAVQRNKDLEA